MSKVITVYVQKSNYSPAFIFWMHSGFSTHKISIQLDDHAVSSVFMFIGWLFLWITLFSSKRVALYKHFYFCQFVEYCSLYANKTYKLE